MTKKYTTWLEISAKAIQHNIRQFQKIVPKKNQFIAIVKSNAYGHGLVEMSRIAKKSGVPWLGTVNLEEALELRKNKISGRILVLSYFHPDKFKDAIQNNITLTIYGYSAAVRINNAAKRQKKTVKIHFKVDTGTSRLGIHPNKCLPIIKKVLKLKYIELEGIFTHFADAENPNQVLTNKQIKVFNLLLTELEKEDIKIKYKHTACSAAVILNKNSYFNMVRVGISLYGLWSIENYSSKVKNIHPKFILRPALSWRTKIIQIKELSSGSTIGYGATYKTSKKIKLALIPVGYWEGYDRKLSNNGEVLVRGYRCPIRGRICMNLTMIDITKVKNAKVGDIVTLIGKDGGQEISVDQIADKTKTINYEVVTRINPLLPRLYI